MVNTKIIYCPCRNNLQYIDCCGRYLDHGEVAATAKILMRSRYTAYTLNREDYLLATWHHSTHPASLELNLAHHQWLGLAIKHYEQSTANHGTVEFVARYKINGRAYRLHEISRFIRNQEPWFYVDGDIVQDNEKKRN